MTVGQFGEHDLRHVRSNIKAAKSSVSQLSTSTLSTSNPGAISCSSRIRFNVLHKTSACCTSDLPFRSPSRSYSASSSELTVESAPLTESVITPHIGPTALCTIATFSNPSEFTRQVEPAPKSALPKGRANHESRGCWCYSQKGHPLHPHQSRYRFFVLLRACAKADQCEEPETCCASNTFPSMNASVAKSVPTGEQALNTVAERNKNSPEAHSSHLEPPQSMDNPRPEFRGAALAPRSG